MTKTHKAQEENEEKIVKENIQKRFKTMFSGKGEPLSNMSIQEVEALQARVAELEEKLNQEPGPVEEKSTSVAAQQNGSSFEVATIEPPKHEDVIELWRERWVNLILRGCVALGLIGLIVTVVIAVQKQNWRDSIIGLIVYLILVAITFLKVPYRARAHGLVTLILGLFLNSLTQSGVRGDANIFLVTVITLAFMLLGWRTGLVITSIGVLATLGMGWGVINQQISLRDLFDQLNLNTWIAHSIFPYMLSGIIATGILTLQGEFSAAQQREQTAIAEIYEERVHLVERVKERTHDLELASEVGRTVSEKVKNLSEMLTEAVEMIRARFALYYTQIYLTDSSEKNIVLRAGTGEVGQELLQKGHHLSIASGSLNGRAASEKRTIIVADTRDDPNFLSNPLLPKTRSEMSIPLMAGGRVVGVLDLQSEQPRALNQANLPAFEALAGQLAIAVENAALFAQAEEARTEVETQVRRLTEQGWQDFLDGIDRGQKIGYALDQSKVVRLEADALSTIPKERDLNIPITITGTQVGEIRFPAQQKHAWTANELERIRATSAQLAQHIENLRLLAQAERYRSEAEQAVHQLTREGWDTFQQLHTEATSGYVFDLTEVRPLPAGSNGSTSNALKQPMLIRGEAIGELAVEANDQQEEAEEFLNAISQQLSTHIESLRLSELNERHAQREQTLRQITSALRSSTNPTTIMRTAVRELGHILGRRTVVQLATPEETRQTETVVNDENKANSPAHQS